MLENNQNSVDANVSSVSRRSVLKAAAWSLPAIAVASSVPALAASLLDPQGSECIVQTGVWETPIGELFMNGADGTPAGEFGNWTTGWTPVESTHDNGHITTNWWNGHALPAGQVGFMSMDDNDNRDLAPVEPSVISVDFIFEGKVGRKYDLAFPIWTAAAYLGAQYVDVNISGPGINALVGRGSTGNLDISTVPTGFESYPAIPSHVSVPSGPSITYNYSAVPTADGPVIITYTFTLAYVQGGQRQNADIWVQSPTVMNCVA